ncbi:hypothetical protein CR956_01815 [Candidatus Saccharibacteria bacterium]|nr:MAG: hypothetical protein CR956_01815 [Candidatus Saccharibacteria bacterium]
MLRRQRGDTIVEVAVAFAIFGMLIVVVSIMMSRGMSVAQESLETTLVSEQLDNQSEMLTFVRDTDPSLWSDIKSSANSNPPITVSQIMSSDCDNPPSGSFFLTTEAVGGKEVIKKKQAASPDYSKPFTYSQVESGRSQGIWVEVRRAEGSSDVGMTDKVDAYDMYIRSCWYPPGAEDKPKTVGTVVRLYDNHR